MYGYFRPNDSGLTGSELKLFYAYYCRLCYCLRLTGGQRARCCTTYDAVVYSLILNLQKGEKHPPCLRCQKVAKGNMKKFSCDQTGLKFARLTLISFGEKIADDIIDENKLKHRLANKLFARGINNARRQEPLLAQNGDEGMVRIRQLQNENAPIFEVLAAYEDMAAKAFSTFTQLTPVTEELIRSVSAWIYFIDMVCDYAEDYKNGAYNPLKTEGLKTFAQYFNAKYNQFLSYEKRITGRLVAALLAADNGSQDYNTLFKVLINAVNSVIPGAIMGKDIQFHYVSNLLHTYGQLYRHNAKAKKLGNTGNEKG